MYHPGDHRISEGGRDWGWGVEGIIYLFISSSRQYLLTLDIITSVFGTKRPKSEWDVSTPGEVAAYWPWRRGRAHLNSDSIMHSEGLWWRSGTDLQKYEIHFIFFSRNMNFKNREWGEVLIQDGGIGRSQTQFLPWTQWMYSYGTISSRKNLKMAISGPSH